MSRTSAGIQYNARSMNGIISINADEITCSGTITSDLIKASNLLEADTPETINAQWTYNVLPQSTAVPTLGPQLTNKTYVDGAITSGLSGYVTLSTTQTITGAKTINANLRLNNTRQLIFGTTTGAVLNFTGANMYYDNQVGGGHYFFVSGLPNTYIDTDGVNIENNKYLYFNGKRCSLIDNGTALVYNVPTGNSHSLRINNVEHLKVQEDIYGTFWKMPNSMIREQTIYPALIFDVPNTYDIRLTINNQDALKVSYDNTNGSILTFSAGSVMREYLSFNWLLYQVPLGYIYKYDIDGTMALQLSAGGILVNGSLSIQNGSGGALILDDSYTGGRISGYSAGGIRFDSDTGSGGFIFVDDSTTAFTIQSTKVTVPTNQICQFGITGSSIGYSAGTNEIQYKVPTGKIHNFHVNGVSTATLDASGVIIQSTAVGGAGFPNQLLYLSQNKANYIGSSTTDMRYNCSSGGSHNFYQNGTTYLGFLNSLGMTLSPNNTQLQLGTTGVVSFGHDSAGTASQYRVPATWVHNFQVGGVGVAQIRSEGFYSFQNNTALQLGATNPIKIKHDTATSQVQYIANGSTYSHMFYINGVDLYYEMRTDTFRALRGYQNKLGATGAYISNNFNFSWNNPSAGNLSVWIDTTRLGNMSIVSDYRLKENIVPARPVLDRLCKIKMIEYEFKNVSIFKKNGISHGFIAHEVAELFPELINIIHGEKDALTDDGLIQPQTVGGELTNLYLSAIQELNAKIEAQQKVIENQQKQIDQLIVLFSSRMV